jgi:hypothetical protein
MLTVQQPEEANSGCKMQLGARNMFSTVAYIVKLTTLRACQKLITLTACLKACVGYTIVFH